LNAIAETSRAAGSRWGGIRGYWGAEAGTKTASAPKFRQMELTLKKLIGLCYATDELLADAAALESVIMQGFSEEFGFLLDDGLINGTGAGQPLGIMNSPSLVTVTRNTALHVYSEDVIAMWARCWAKSRPNAVWFINQAVEPELHKLNLGGGTAGSGVILTYMPPGGLSASPYGTIYGRPVIPIEQCAALGTTGDIILADFSEYVMIEKGGMQSASSIHVRFVNDETTFRFVMRVDGQPAWNAPLTPYKGTGTLSPFVVLSTV
jgi:HK97 family phage major capsid protein